MKRANKRLIDRCPVVMGVLILCAGLVAGCGGPADEHAGDEHSELGEEEGHEERAAVRLDPGMMAELGVEVAAAGPGELALHIALSGEVRLNEDRVAHIVPRSPGIVREVKKSVGEFVEEGEVLAILESPELGRVKVSYLASLQGLELAETDLTRMEQIHRNTKGMLTLLESSPTLEELRKFAGKEMGDNRSELVSAYAEFVVSKTTWEREKRLFERKIASESDYLAAETGLKKAEAEYVATLDSTHFALRRDLLQASRVKQLAEFEVRSTDRQLHVLGLSDAEIETLVNGGVEHAKLGWYALRAPFRGRVVDRHITLGEMLETVESAFTVADLSNVWVDLTVYQKDLDKVAEGQSARVRAGPGIEEISRVIYVSPVVEEATRAAVARLVLDNPRGSWKPGMFVTASLEHGRVSAPVVVLKSAVQTIDGEAVIFVATDEGFEPRDVELGRRNDVHLEVVSGLAAGDRYVSKGAFVLKAELQKSSFGGGHGH